MSSPFTMIDVPLSPDASSIFGGVRSLRVPFEVLYGVLFRADQSVSPTRRPDGTDLLRLGRLRMSSLLCLDPQTREVHDIPDPDSAVQRQMPSRWFEYVTNASLDQFVAICRAISDRFPFYSRDSGYDEMHAAARGIEALVSAIDPPAGVPDTYWTTFADDVNMGDFPTEDVVPSHVTLPDAD